MSRPKRQLKKNYKVFCEGDTEFYYIEGFRKQHKLLIKIKTIDMEGGGYKNFLAKIKQESDSNCLAKFIVIDGDRAYNDGNEKANLEEIIRYCKVQNDSKRCPHVLIINYPDFEYVGCSHSEMFNGQQNTSVFIERVFNFPSVSDFKKNDKVYAFLTKGNNSVENMITALRSKSHYITNEIKPLREPFSISVDGPIYNAEAFGKKGSNFEDFFKVINMFGIDES